MARITLKNVKKIYQNGVVAVNNFSLDIKDKEFLVIVGPSGCGKSTILRLIAGLEDINEGQIKFDNKVVNNLSPKDRNVSMVFQNYALFPHLNVFDNIAFSLRTNKHLKLTKEEINKKVEDTVKLLKIENYLYRKPKELSGGQRQRVAIAKAIVKDCKVYLFDEPLSNLDEKLRNELRREFLFLRKRLNSTFVYVTHDQREAMTLGDRIVVMNDGKIQQVGTPDEIFEKPNNLFVASFIGAPAMNIIPCTLSLRKNKYYVNPFNINIEVPSLKATVLKKRKYKDCPIILCIRPEHIKLVSNKISTSIKGKITFTENMGNELFLHVNIKDNNKIIVRIPVDSINIKERNSLLQIGKYINLMIDSKMIHFFNPKNQINMLSKIKK